MALYATLPSKPTFAMGFGKLLAIGGVIQARDKNRLTDLFRAR